MDKRIRAIAKKNKAAKQAKEAKKPEESKPAAESDDEPPAVIVGGSAAPSEKASVSKSKSAVSVMFFWVCLFCVTGKLASAMCCRIPSSEHAAFWYAALEKARVGSTSNTTSGLTAATYQSPCTV